MRFLIVLLVIVLSISLMAETPKENYYIRSMKILTNKESKIIEHLKDIDAFLVKYNKYLIDYLDKVNAILSNDKNSNTMKVYKLEELKNRKREMSKLKQKIDDIMELREIDIEELRTINKYKTDLISDLVLYNK